MKEKITIIGAGPAGSTAAILLSRANFLVTLIEQHRFPRDKVCGECLSALAIDVLDRIGALNLVRQAGAVELHRAIVHSPNGSTLELRLPRKMLGLSRATLDSILLNVAGDAGATIEHRRFEATDTDRMLIATGKHSYRPRDIGIKAHFANVDTPRDAIALFGIRGSYGGIAPIENGLFNIAFSVPADRLKHAQDDALFAAIVEENRSLKPAMRCAHRVSGWLSAPLQRFGVCDFDEQSIPIGNAACSIEPIGGEGIGLAMRSAELAASAIVRSEVHQLHREYKQLWGTRRFACRAAAMILSRPALANFLIDGVDGQDAILAAIFRLIGKSPAIA